MCLSSTQSVPTHGDAAEVASHTTNSGLIVPPMHTCACMRARGRDSTTATMHAAARPRGHGIVVIAPCTSGKRGRLAAPRTGINARSDHEASDSVRVGWAMEEGARSIVVLSCTLMN